MTERDHFATIRAARRIWVIGAIHGDASRLFALHDLIAEQVRFGDRLVYTGNALGHGGGVVETVNEMLTFRRWFLSIPPHMHSDDVIYLRGAQEEMWQKLLQLQFAQQPAEILEWVNAKGVDATIRSYGLDPAEGLARAREGTLALTHWTSALKDAIHSHPGHDDWMIALKHAARTENDSSLIFNAGLDFSKPLEKQADTFWWAGRNFERAFAPYAPFQRLIRGYDPSHGGYREDDNFITVDGGCGFGGPLMAVCLDPMGAVLDLLKV